jgi:hypothetical protein
LTATTTPEVWEKLRSDVRHRSGASHAQVKSELCRQEPRATVEQDEDVEQDCDLVSGKRGRRGRRGKRGGGM